MGRLGVRLEGSLVVVYLVEPDAVLVSGVLDNVEATATGSSFTEPFASSMIASMNWSLQPGLIWMGAMITYIGQSPCND